ncbi:response regulator transcription factor [Gorillibacterium massiliense]|uniref:response regulator transcription factor n=1 Tax=Gorillibacterium massiliense TaxID=1280390 RepID=UPI0004B25527|nr:response regulator transcription factor [Gorillibacterium massiliense]
MTMQKILVVEDDPSIAKLIDFNLRTAGYEVRCVYEGDTVLPACAEFQPDLIVLDLMLPRIDGLQVCRNLRSAKFNMPIIILSALSDLSDRITGLDNGADDYMTKPFSPQELVSRIKAVLRRSGTLQEAKDDDAIVLVAGNIRLSPASREVRVGDTLIELSPKEFELLHYLCRHRGRVMTRGQLLQGVWNYSYSGETRIVDVHISHLREKIEPNPRIPEYIMTVRSVGYKLADPPRERQTPIADMRA